MSLPQVIFTPVLFALAFVLSTIVIRCGIPCLESDNTAGQPIDGEQQTPTRMLPESSSSRIFDWSSTGIWIGLFEMIITFALIFVDQFGALAIIIGTKQVARMEQSKKNPSYYVLGTLINLSTALLLAMFARSLG